VYLYVIRVSNINKICIPSLWMLLIITHQNLNQCPIDYFYLKFVYLSQIGVHILPKCSPKGTKKYGIPISDDAPRYPKVNPNLFNEHVWCFFSFDGIFTRHNNADLDKPINYHKQMFMSLPGCWKTTQKIHGDAILGSSGYR